MPSWIQGFARHQPVTPVIKTCAACSSGRLLAPAPGRRSPAILAVSVAVSGVLLQRRAA
jgi:hypothetical protein